MMLINVNRLGRVVLALMALGIIARAQSPQTIDPSDSLETRRLKMNANTALLNAKATSAVSNAHTHPNKSVLDKIPPLFGDAFQFLRLNSSHDGFEWAAIQGGAGINISNVNGTLTISLNNANGITSLNGLTGPTQTFANDANVIVTSTGTQHALGWTGQLAPGRGGTGSAFVMFQGAASTVKHYVLPNVDNATILTDAAPVTVAQGGSGVNTITGIVLGNGTSPFSAITNSAGLAAAIGDATGVGVFVRNSSPSLVNPNFGPVVNFLNGAESRYLDASNVHYVGFKANAPGANKIYQLPDTVGTPNQMLTLLDPTTGQTGWATPPGATGGEANTASNVGTGQGLFKQKSGVNLEFRNLAAGSPKAAVATDAPNNNVTVDVVEANLNRANMTGITPVAGGGSGAATLTGLLKGNGTLPFTAVAAPAGAIVGDSDAQTLTNKTLNVEAAGNVITTVSKVWLDAAACDGGATASLQWDTFSANAPVAACVVGTNTVKGVADFADGGTDLTMQRTIQLPGDFTGSIDVAFKWFTTATGGNVIWGVAAGCSGDGALDDPSFNPFSDVADIAKGTANQLNDASVSAVNISGCSPGKLLHVKVARRLSQSGDTVAAAARLVGVEITLRRAQ